MPLTEDIVATGTSNGAQRFHGRDEGFGRYGGRSGNEPEHHFSVELGRGSSSRHPFGGIGGGGGGGGRGEVGAGGGAGGGGGKVGGTPITPDPQETASKRRYSSAFSSAESDESAAHSEGKVPPCELALLA
jgi:hypothetical protein